MGILSSKSSPDKLCYYCRQRPARKNQGWCQPCHNEYQRTHYDQAKRRNWNLKTHFGISQDDYNIMLFIQGGVCALCGKEETNINPQTGRVWPLCVDHHHGSGLVRELLCHRCNFLVGMVEQDRGFTKKILKYLRKHDM